jgi:3-oxoacyl-[acyl-carrier protein] reductase
MDLGLKGKIVIVTGSGQGIGKDIALAFTEEESIVILNDIESVAIDRVADEIASKGGEALPLTADVVDKSSVQKMVTTVLKKYERIDILVNNAGILRRGFFEDLEESDWDKTIDVNLKGVFNCCQAVIKCMKEQNNGKIVNCASIIAQIPDVGLAPYAVSKAGVVTLTKILAAELAPFNINVNAYMPGVVETPMTSDLIEHRGEEKLRYISLRRFAKPRDIANLVLFLASDVSNYITGSVIDISGGNLIVQRPWVSYER